MTRPILLPPTPGPSLLRLRTALLCIHVLQGEGVEIVGMSPRELLAWAGVPESELSPAVPEDLLPEYTARASMARQAEWRRSIAFPKDGIVGTHQG